MRRLRFTGLLLVLFAMAASARAETTGSGGGMAAPGAKLIDWGIYFTDRTGKRKAPRTATGSTNTVARTKLVRKTDRIMAQMGLRFGIRYHLGSAVAPGERVTYRITHPPLTNPKTGKTIRISVWS
jgi:hypothetical protein